MSVHVHSLDSEASDTNSHRDNQSADAAYLEPQGASTANHWHSRESCRARTDSSEQSEHSLGNVRVMKPGAAMQWIERFMTNNARTVYR